MRTEGRDVPSRTAVSSSRTTAQRESEQVAKLLRLVRVFCRHLQVAEEAAQDVQFYLDELCQGEFPHLLPQRRRRFSRPSVSDDTELLKKLASLGVADVKIARDADDWATVVVERSRLRLSPALADLLEILCEDSGPRIDGLVGWKTTADLVRRLRQRTGKAPKPHAIAVSVSRLRAAMKACGINRFLIQTNRRRGYRFAKRVKEPPEIGGNLR